MRSGVVEGVCGRVISGMNIVLLGLDDGDVVVVTVIISYLDDWN